MRKIFNKVHEVMMIGVVGFVFCARGLTDLSRQQYMEGSLWILSGVIMFFLCYSVQMLAHTEAELNHVNSMLSDALREISRRNYEARRDNDNPVSAAVNTLLTFPSRADFPQSGNIGTVYVSLENGRVYQWDNNNSAYSQIRSPGTNAVEELREREIRAQNRLQNAILNVQQWNMAVRDGWLNPGNETYPRTEEITDQEIQNMAEKKKTAIKRPNIIKDILLRRKKDV